MQIKAAHTKADIVNQIDNGVAIEVKKAYFEQGLEDEIKTSFYWLWGSLIRMVYNSHTTTTHLYFVEGENKDIFTAYYGKPSEYRRAA